MRQTLLAQKPQLGSFFGFGDEYKVYALAQYYEECLFQSVLLSLGANLTQVTSANRSPELERHLADSGKVRRDTIFVQDPVVVLEHSQTVIHCPDMKADAQRIFKKMRKVNKHLRLVEIADSYFEGGNVAIVEREGQKPLLIHMQNPDGFYYYQQAASSIWRARRPKVELSVTLASLQRELSDTYEVIGIFRDVRNRSGYHLDCFSFAHGDNFYVLEAMDAISPEFLEILKQKLGDHLIDLGHRVGSMLNPQLISSPDGQHLLFPEEPAPVVADRFIRDGYHVVSAASLSPASAQYDPLLAERVSRHLRDEFNMPTATAESLLNQTHVPTMPVPCHTGKIIKPDAFVGLTFNPVNVNPFKQRSGGPHCMALRIPLPPSTASIAGAGMFSRGGDAAYVDLVDTPASEAAAAEGAIVHPDSTGGCCRVM
ncbi:MAG: hypothetical protein P1U63_05140 [Coxiellaceae bacterium]|nr:hypothetical protein [Coxiellaceae bacterium]